MYLGKSVFGRTGFQDFVCPSGAISGLFLHFSRQIAELSSFEKRCKMPRNPLPMAYTNKVKKLFKIFYNPEKNGFSRGGFRILFAHRGLFRVYK